MLSLLVAAALVVVPYCRRAPEKLPAVTPPNKNKEAPGTRINSYFSPDGGAEKAMVREIGKSTKRVRVAVYFFTQKDFAAALIAAKKRGALVEVIVDKTQENRKDSMVPLLQRNGIKGRRGSADTDVQRNAARRTLLPMCG